MNPKLFNWIKPSPRPSPFSPKGEGDIFYVAFLNYKTVNQFRRLDYILPLLAGERGEGRGEESGCCMVTDECRDPVPLKNLGSTNFHPCAKHPTV